jgi:tetratricopeptide (TPR) repeat protein
MSETTDNSLGFPLKGTLRRSPFPKLVRQLARTKSTGSLYLLNGKTKKVVFFDRGEPISVRSNVTAECLGQILAREGLITQAQCDQTLESIRRTGKKQGELLIEMGILSEGNLRYGLEAQLRHKLFDIFSWEDGRYQYKPEIKGDDYGLRFNTDAQGLILTALLETAEESRARSALDPYADRFPVIDAPNGLRLEITPEEQYFLTVLDGSSNIAELLERSAEPPVPSAALLLYAAIQAGVAKLAKSRRQPRDRPSKPEDGRTKPDRALQPGYGAKLTVTTYEDTPLPGELPKPPDVELSSRHSAAELEDDFGEGDGDDEPSIKLPPSSSREVDSQLVAAERDTPDETFEEELEAPADEPPAPDDGLRAATLVADPAESGVFQRVLLDDDDESSLPPLTDDDETEHAMPAMADAPRMDGPEPASLDSAAPVPDPTLELEEIEEIEELDDLEEALDEDEEDEEPAPAPAPKLRESARPTEIPTDVTPDTGVPVAAASSAHLTALADDLEADDDLALDDALDALDQDLPLDDNSLDAPIDAELAAQADELVGLEDLDDIDLPLEASQSSETDEADEGGYDVDETSEADSETMGALHFGDGETAIAERRWAEAITHLEAAYENGIDVAELHAWLAWARFQSSGESTTMADHALELLAYAEEMSPNLAMVHAYRSAILLSLGDSAGAQDAAQAALDIDPYDELAIDVMDKLV